MTNHSRIVFDALVNAGYEPDQVYFYNNFQRKNFGWFVTMDDESVYYLGRRVDSALYNIERKIIKQKNDA